MRPGHAVLFLEQQHANMYGFFEKNPNVGRGLFFVCGAIDGLAPVVKAVAFLVESLVFLIINLVGAIFDPKMLKDAKDCAIYSAKALFWVLKSPFEGCYCVIDSIFSMIFAPKDHSLLSRKLYQELANWIKVGIHYDSTVLQSVINKVTVKLVEAAYSAVVDADEDEAIDDIFVSSDNFTKQEKLLLKAQYGGELKITIVPNYQDEMRFFPNTPSYLPVTLTLQHIAELEANDRNILTVQVVANQFIEQL